jgi:putative lipoic acid-binding regulatory protein
MKQRSLLEFPCKFPIKVFGRNESAFRDAVRAIVSRHFGPADPPVLSERSSSSETYLSITVTVHAHTREQIDDAYRDLTSHEDIMMVL